MIHSNNYRLFYINIYFFAIFFAYNKGKNVKVLSIRFKQLWYFKELDTKVLSEQDNWGTEHFVLPFLNLEIKKVLEKLLYSNLMLQSEMSVLVI